jgi:hypothetical protein
MLLGPARPLVVVTIACAMTAVPGCRTARFAQLGSSAPAAMTTAGTAAAAARMSNVDEAVATLLARHVGPTVIQASAEDAAVSPALGKRIAILPAEVDAATAAEDGLAGRLGATIAARLDESQLFERVSDAEVAAAIEAASLSPDDLGDRTGSRALARAFQERGTDVDYLLRPRVAADRRLVLELVDARTGTTDSQAIALRHRSPRLAFWQAD